jgi:hypothetical protein
MKIIRSIIYKSFTNAIIIVYRNLKRMNHVPKIILVTVMAELRRQSAESLKETT